jgi:two-component system, NarL family, nitrate/nitrite response regulator NarL
MRPVRVLAADRQPLFREALARAVRRCSSLQLVAETADGRAALAAIERYTPDVAVIDLRLPLLDGRRVLNAVVRDELATRVVLVAAAFDGRTAYDALAAGAAGVLSKALDHDQVRAAVESVARGAIVIGEREQTVVAREIWRRASAAPPLLTERERSVLLLVAAGRGPAAIATALELGPATVKAVLLELYRRFGVSDRAALVAAALRRGLIE